MQQDDVDSMFEKMVGMSRISDMEALIGEVLRLEGVARLLTAEGEHEAANESANEAYRLFMAAPAMALPTLIMGLADRCNRAVEAMSVVLDATIEARGHLENAKRRAEAGMSQLALHSVLFALDSINAVVEEVDPE